MKKHFVLKLIPNRPSFAQDMTNEERMVMQKHVAYWTKLMSEGKVLVFGPVLDPAATYGLGIVEVDSEEDVKELIANDPAISINNYEYYSMLAITPNV
ncbi:YciI family protein [Chitinophagaceae bacterium LWZ2-11]